MEDVRGLGHAATIVCGGAEAFVAHRDLFPETLSLGTATHLPTRLLLGILPQDLLQRYAFWQDEADHLRGYPRDEARSMAQGARLAARVGARRALPAEAGGDAVVVALRRRNDRVGVAAEAVWPGMRGGLVPRYAALRTT